jgi:UDP-arabinose 4-epimerase
MQSSRRIQVKRYFDDTKVPMVSVTLLYFNAAGADPNTDPNSELGKYHDPETHLIPLAIEAATSGVPLSVFGTDYPTPDGTAIRDYTHVVDLATAHVKASRYLETGGDSITLNFGTGNGHSVRQVIQEIGRQAGRSVPVAYCPRRLGDAPALVADPARAQHVLNWIPRYSSLDVIVETAWQCAYKVI